jgi:hypothetical protein
MSFKEEFQKEQQRIIIDDIIEKLSNENLGKLIRLIESGKLKEMLKKISIPELTDDIKLYPFERYAIYGRFSE